MWHTLSFIMDLRAAIRLETSPAARVQEIDIKYLANNCRETERRGSGRILNIKSLVGSH